MMIITHCADEPHRTCTAMGIPSCLIVEGADVALFFMFKGWVDAEGYGGDHRRIKDCAGQ
jgi:hypothetical protein